MVIKPKIKTYFMVELIVIFLILALAGYLRFYHLRTNPDWFQDEGEFIQIAKGLLTGDGIYMGLKGSMLFIGRPPTFFLLLAGAFKLFRADILVLRGLTVAISLVTILLVYLTARRILGIPAAILAALFLSILPEEIMFNRLGFTYNWLALLFVLVVFAAWNYLENFSPRWLALAALTAGLAFASDFLGIVIVVSLFFVIISVKPRNFGRTAIYASIPLLLVIVPMYILYPKDIWFDLTNSIPSGVNRDPMSLVVTLIVTLAIIGEMVREQTWVVVGMFGLFTLTDRRLRRLLIGLCFFILLVFATIRQLNSQYLLPIWPFVAIGIGGLCVQGIPIVLKAIKNSTKEWYTRLPGIQKWLSPRIMVFFGSLISILFIFIFIINPILQLLFVDIYEFYNGPDLPSHLIAYNYPAGFTPAKDILQVVDYLAPRIKPDDLVVASAHVGWAIPARLITFAVFVNYVEGGKVPGVPKLDSGRFAYDLSMNNIKYVIIDSNWREWNIDRPGYQEAINKIELWPVVSTQGRLSVYCNPSECR